MSLFQSGFLTAGQPIQVATLEFLLVGGGGGGGNSNANVRGNLAGGGGAGGFVTASVPFYQQQPSANITIGSAGGYNGLDTRGSSGGDTSAFSLTAFGGGGGGAYNGASRTGGDGSSGGGGACAGTSAAGGGSGITGQGFRGGNAHYANPVPSDPNFQIFEAGCGGGAGGAATNASSSDRIAISSIAGPGKVWDKDNESGSYSAGGVGMSGLPTTGSIGGYGNGGDGSNSAFSQNGQPGICKIRYSGSVALFTGGTTSVSGGYVYHTFTSSGVFDYNLYP
jgi:hypothetical protein